MDGWTGRDDGMHIGMKKKKKGNRTEIISCGGKGESGGGKKRGMSRRWRRGRNWGMEKTWSNRLSSETLLPLVPRQLDYIDSLSPLLISLLLFTFSLPPPLFPYAIIKGLRDRSRYLDLSRLLQIPHRTLINGGGGGEEAPSGIPHWIGRIGRTTHSLHTLRGYLPDVHPICPISGPRYSIHHYKYLAALAVLIWIPHSSTDRKWNPCIIYKVHIFHQLCLFMASISFQPQTGAERCLRRRTRTKFNSKSFRHSLRIPKGNGRIRYAESWLA
ncbi:hypothetical protein HOY80DRAFT_34752 [Tuber brumale]|nr:hypothetical protein HOY80DRAFT_34752 [Tuber brumale]